MLVQPYLFFNGRCEEALNFYREKLGAEVLFQTHFRDAPPDSGHTPAPGTEDKIMHCTFRIGTTELMGSDGNCEPGADKPGGFRRRQGIGREAFQRARRRRQCDDAVAADVLDRALWYARRPLRHHVDGDDSARQGLQELIKAG